MTKWTFCFELVLPSDSNKIIINRQYYELFSEKEEANSIASISVQIQQW